MGDTVVSPNGEVVPPLKFGPHLFLDKNTVIYGPSHTGKTVLTKNIMRILNGLIPEILIVCPTEPANRSYEGFVDAPLIHYRIYLPDILLSKEKRKKDDPKGPQRFLETIFQRQEMKASIYRRANNIKILSKLYLRIPGKKRRNGDTLLRKFEKSQISTIKQIRRKFRHEPGLRKQREDEVRNKFEQMLALIYKKYITPLYATLLKKQNLTEDERYSLRYLCFNPRLLIIFDDCAAELKPLCKKEVFRKLFYQGRHCYVTSIIACQDDTDLPTNLRKNAFVSLFTENVVCSSNFERGSNRYSKKIKLYVQEIGPAVFEGHRKLAYIRDDKNKQNFYHITVPFPKKFRFGNQALRDLCKMVKAHGTMMDKENPFYGKFKV